MYIYIHYSLSVRLLSITPMDLEMLWIGLKLGKKEYMIGCLYRPPNSSVKFWSSLEDALGSLDGYEVILMGELNVDFSDQRDKNYVHMKHVCLSLNLRNLNSSPTRITATTAKTLDVVLTNIEQCLITGGITEQVDFSDHAAVFCSIMRPENATRRPDNLESSVVVRSWPNGGQGNATTQMEEALARHMGTLTSSGINPMWNEWKTKFIAALDEVAPQGAVRKKKRDRRCPWMTQELLHLLHQQKSLFKKIKKSKKPCVEWRAQHRQLRNKYSTLYRQLRNEHFQTTIGSYRHNP